jgi:hypothetical protein
MTNLDKSEVKTCVALLPQEVRLEMLIGHLADTLAFTKKTLEAIRLQANASVTTRSKLEHLIDCNNHSFQMLIDIQTHIESFYLQLERDDRAAIHRVTQSGNAAAGDDDEAAP